VTKKNAVFWDVAPCRSYVNRLFGGTYRLHLQGRKFRERGTSVSRWLQTAVHTRSTRRHIPKDGILLQYLLFIGATRFYLYNSTNYPPILNRDWLYVNLEIFFSHITLGVKSSIQVWCSSVWVHPNLWWYNPRLVRRDVVVDQCRVVRGVAARGEEVSLVIVFSDREKWRFIYRSVLTICY
jgi:hypothetical protein